MVERPFLLPLRHNVGVLLAASRDVVSGWIMKQNLKRHVSRFKAWKYFATEVQSFIFRQSIM